MFDNIMSDGMHQMRLSKSRSSVNKQRIIGISRRFRYRKGRCLGKLIVAAHNKGVKSIFWIQMSFLAALVAERSGGRCIIIRSIFFFRHIFGKNKFNFAAFHPCYFTDCHLQWKFILFCNNIDEYHLL